MNHLEVVERMLSDPASVCPLCAEKKQRICIENGEPCRGPSKLQTLDVMDATEEAFSTAPCVESACLCV